MTGKVIAMGGGMYEAEFVVTRSGQYDLQVRQLYLPWLHLLWLHLLWLCVL